MATHFIHPSPPLEFLDVLICLSFLNIIPTLNHSLFNNLMNLDYNTIALLDIVEDLSSTMAKFGLSDVKGTLEGPGGDPVVVMYIAL